MTARHSIIIADDHALVREGLKLLLGTEPGLEVVAHTGDGAAVEALVRQHRPDLLVLDLDMPQRNGMDIAAAIKGDAGLATRVLVLTGNLKPQVVSQALAVGADGYLLKSEDSGELLQAVHAVLGGGEYVSKAIASVFQPGSKPAPPGGSTSGDAAITPREREILSLVARGLNNNDIAGLLAISVLTVRTHRQRLMEKLALRNAAEITAYAVKQGFYDPS
jgi:DNA-binding NarL/FixJ family response regulator